jgi:hypothetical protein
MPYALELEHFAAEVKACRNEDGHVDWAENMLESGATHSQHPLSTSFLQNCVCVSCKQFQSSSIQSFEEVQMKRYTLLRCMHGFCGLRLLQATNTYAAQQPESMQHSRLPSMRKLQYALLDIKSRSQAYRHVHANQHCPNNSQHSLCWSCDSSTSMT